MASRRDSQRAARHVETRSCAAAAAARLAARSLSTSAAHRFAHLTARLRAPCCAYTSILARAPKSAREERREFDGCPRNKKEVKRFEQRASLSARSSSMRASSAATRSMHRPHQRPQDRSSPRAVRRYDAKMGRSHENASKHERPPAADLLTIVKGNSLLAFSGSIGEVVKRSTATREPSVDHAHPEVQLRGRSLSALPAVRSNLGHRTA